MLPAKSLTEAMGVFSADGCSSHNSLFPTGTGSLSGHSLPGHVQDQGPLYSGLLKICSGRGQAFQDFIPHVLVSVWKTHVGSSELKSQGWRSSFPSDAASIQDLQGLLERGT
jgi:hypothetical protein